MNISETKNLLKSYHIRPNKLRGQNFLVNPSAAEKIIEAARISPQETVLEIGPGLGALTRGLLEKARLVIAVEIEVRLCTILRDRLGGCPGLELVNEDFLKVDLAAMTEKAGADRLRIIGNLPYHITGLAVRKILDHMPRLHGAVITVQREVADRMVALPGSKSFGALSVAAQYHSRPQPLFRLSRESFYPVPQVISTVVALEPRDEPPTQVSDEHLFFKVVRALFGHRRKTVRNALRADPNLRLSGEMLDEISRKTGLDLSRRGETMNLTELGRLANALGESRHGEAAS